MKASDQLWIELMVPRVGACAGTIHRRDGGCLYLTAAHNIPEVVQSAVECIPEGKGMAGLAWARGRPVSTCNLATDATGDVRPGARAVDARAAAAVPVIGRYGIYAVVGFAFDEERDLGDAALEQLVDLAATLPYRDDPI